MIDVRVAVEADLDRIVELNNAAVPGVSPTDRAALEALIAVASVCWVVDAPDTDRVDAFVLLFGPGADYASPNYRWFSDRYDRFLYVDRVVVDEGRRGDGWGTRLYDLVAERAASTGAGRVTAEVNLEPPNPGSSRFHRRHGFEPVGELRHGDTYVVEMLARPVVAGSGSDG